MAEAMRARAAGERRDALLFTPGPLTTSARVKAAMARDWGSRDQAFLTINREVLEQLALIVTGGASHVPVPGSGTFAVEALLTTLVPRTGKVLVLSNGVYGERARSICEIAGRAVIVHSTAEDAPPDLARVARLLADDKAIAHLLIVHCETTSGILDPLAEVAPLAARHRVGLLVDAIPFGALPHDAAALGCLGSAASSSKCLEGVPGLGFVVPAHRARGVPRQRDDAGLRPVRPVVGLARQRAVPLHAADTRHRRPPPGTRRAARRGRTGRPGAALSAQLRGAGRRHARARVRAAAGQRPTGADHRHVADAAGSPLRIRGLECAPGGAGLSHLPRHADPARQLPHRLHRQARRRRHARPGPGPCRDARRARARAGRCGAPPLSGFGRVAMALLAGRAPAALPGGLPDG
jgi:hypothetical protein